MSSVAIGKEDRTMAEAFESSCGTPPEAGVPARWILLVEDCPAQALLVREGFRQIGGLHRIEVAPTGEEGVLALGSSAPHLPDLVLLDLNLPGMSGLDVLREIRSTARWCRIPVIIFSTSHARADIDACYEAGANAYLAKPMGLSDLRALLQRVVDFWLSSARLPAP